MARVTDKPRYYVGVFEKTGLMAQPWVDAGYKAICVDIDADEGEREGIEFIRADMRTWVPPREVVEEGVAVYVAFPPCDHLAVSGACWFKGKGLGALAESVTLFERAAFWAEWLGAPYMIENPVSTISTYWRKPDHNFDPCDYGGYLPEDDVNPDWPDYIPPRDAYRKKTCLWTGEGFVMPETRPVDPQNVVVERRDPKKGRNYSPVAAKTGGKSKKTKSIRSASPRGFAKAVFNSNQPHV